MNHPPDNYDANYHLAIRDLALLQFDGPEPYRIDDQTIRLRRTLTRTKRAYYLLTALWAYEGAYHRRDVRDPDQYGQQQAATILIPYDSLTFALAANNCGITATALTLGVPPTGVRARLASLNTEQLEGLGVDIQCALWVGKNLTIRPVHWLRPAAIAGVA